MVEYSDFLMSFPRNFIYTKNLSEYMIFSKGMNFLFKYLIKEGNTVIEIGSANGFHTFELPKLVRESGKVYAFKPSSYNYS